MGFVKKIGQAVGLVAPDGPSAAETLAAQTAANNQTQDRNLAQNRVNQVGPDGTSTWSKAADGTWTQTTALSGNNQALYDQQQNLSKQLGTAAQTSLDQVTSALAKPIDMSGLPALKGGPGAAGFQTGQYAHQNVGTERGAIGREVLGNLDTSGVRKLPGEINDTSRQRVEQALMSRLEPQYQRDEAALRNRLLNSGIEVGSDAYNNEMNNFSQRLNDARMQSVIQGGGEESRQVGLQAGLNAQEFGQSLDKGKFKQGADMFMSGQENATSLANAQMGNDMSRFNSTQAMDAARLNADINKQNYGIGLADAQFGNQTRAQGLTEQTTLRQMPISELNALRTGSQPGTPNFGGYYTNSMGAPDAQAAADAQTAQANAQARQIGNIFGTAMSFIPKPSDVHLKTNIKRIGVHPSGVNRYTWDWKDGSGSAEGVIAQELQLVRPDAVSRGANGYLQVDYDLIGGE